MCAPFGLTGTQAGRTLYASVWRPHGLPVHWRAGRRGRASPRRASDFPVPSAATGASDYFVHIVRYPGDLHRRCGSDLPGPFTEDGFAVDPHIHGYRKDIHVVPSFLPLDAGLAVRAVLGAQ